MPKLSEFERYIKQLCEALGHRDRHGGFADYSRGLMLPIERKSVEPLAAHTDPLHVSAKHQSLHHLVAQSQWSDKAVLKCVRDWVMPKLGAKSRFYWIVDDTGFPKKGVHSVGVTRQYCGQLGKQDNCQVAVSLSLASERGSVPIDWRLYLPEKWAKDRRRRKKAGVPEELKFQTKPQIAPLSVKGVSETLTARRWHTVVWREGSNAKLSSRFAAVRVRAAHRDEEGLRAPRAEQWL